MTVEEHEKVQRAFWRSFTVAEIAATVHEFNARQLEDSECFELYRRKLLEAHGVDDIDKIDLTNAPSFEAQVAAYAKWADSRPKKPPVKISYI